MRPSARILGVLTLIELGLALALPVLFQALLHGPSAQVARVLGEIRTVFAAMVPLTVLAAAVVLRVGLGRVDVSPGAPARGSARRRALETPLHVASAVLWTSALAVSLLVIRLVLLDTPPSVVVAIGLCAAAILALVPVPLYALCRLVLLPLALSLGDERTPDARPRSLALLLGYCLVAVASAALVPAAVFGSAQLDAAALADAAERARNSGERLAVAAAELDVAAATTLLTRTPLSGAARTVLAAPSGLLVPEEAAAELQGRAYVEVPLTGALRGGALRVYHGPRPRARTPLLLVTIGLLGLTLATARRLGRVVARDLRGVSIQLDRISRDEDPGPLHDVVTLEVRRLTRSVNRLLDRIPRFTVESFLAIERAEEAQRLKSRFLANMSHDLRSPLNSILGFSELLLRNIEGDISLPQRAALEHMQERGHVLLRLLTEILDTAKLESGRMELHRQAVPPVQLLRSALQEARRGRKEAIVDQVTVVLRPGLEPVYVDSLRLTQAFTHLLNYAIEAGQAAGDPRVQLRADQVDGPLAASGEPTSGAPTSGRQLVVEVQHAGVIGLDEAGRLFDGFRHVDGRPGLQLALPLARRLAELHGGTVELVNPGRAPTEGPRSGGGDQAPTPPADQARIRLRVPMLQTLRLG